MKNRLGGKIDDDPASKRVLSKDLKPAANHLAGQGNFVFVRTLDQTREQKNPDFCLNAGRDESRNIVEVTSVSRKSGQNGQSIKNSLNKMLDIEAFQGQDSIFLDARGTAVSDNHAKFGVSEVRTKAKHRGLRFIRVVGDSFDLTFWDFG
jgi:hypothetical protein